MGAYATGGISREQLHTDEEAAVRDTIALGVRMVEARAAR